MDSHGKGRSLARFYTIMSLTAFFLPTIGGVLLDRMGMIEGFRMGLIFSSTILFIQSIANAKCLKEIPLTKRSDDDTSSKKIGEFIKDILKPITTNRNFQIIVIGQSIISFGIGLVN